MGRTARERALRLHWSAAVDGFSLVAEEALARARVAGHAVHAGRATAAEDPAVAEPGAVYLPQPSGAAPSEPA
jgi:hypothetical protein